MGRIAEESSRLLCKGLHTRHLVDEIGDGIFSSRLSGNSLSYLMSVESLEIRFFVLVSCHQISKAFHYLSLNIGNAHHCDDAQRRDFQFGRQ